MRMLGVSYKTAWFMSHRIREGMRPKDFPSMGGSGKLVEVDETYYGPTETPRIPQRKWRMQVTKGGNVGPANKRPIIALVERGGNVRTFHVPVADKRAVTQIARENIARESRLHTDESRLYVGSDRILRRTKRSNIRPTNTYAATFTQTRSKASFRSSNVA